MKDKTMHVKTVTDAAFDESVLKASGTVVVDFWAEWCGPCKMLAPVLEDLAGEVGEKVSFYKMNIEENPHTPGQFAIRGIPTLLLFKDGKKVAEHVGVAPKSKLQGWLDANA